jgi:hypothetical protein
MIALSFSHNSVGTKAQRVSISSWILDVNSQIEYTQPHSIHFVCLFYGSCRKNIVVPVRSCT